MRRAFTEEIAWSDAKQALFELINDELAEPRERYGRLIADPTAVEAELRKGAEKARAVAGPFMAEFRHAVGIRRLGSGR